MNLRLPSAWRERTDWLPPDTTMGQVLRGLRIGGVITFFLILVVNWSRNGVPFARTDLLLWIAIGLACGCIGRHPVWLLWVLLDFVPLVAVLIVYDHLRGIADTVGLPTWWHPQRDIDRALFFGHEPTVFLQEHLKHADVRWYDVAVCACYYTFFFLPYLTAGVMWLRSRTDFYRWSLRFVALSFAGFLLFVLIPAAPPWAAARCTARVIAGHPSNPSCLGSSGKTASGGILGRYTGGQPGTHRYVERTITRGFSDLHLHVATRVLEEGRVSADAVAAVPSLHLGGTVLFVLFMWPRLNRWWRPMLVAYPLVMTFSLVYTAEHYVTDCLAGALVALVIHKVGNRIERRRRPDQADHTPDTLSECLQPETMPSST
ncbi:phosphatase PAP2 family protein [uncultured Jatrophihabitans sp.]|uniref:phosphatase PAP2 family protein n=1 Tax=uncultured Jatrophihabitans sp. TaxID=1610747 RepID=UPI0035C95A82